MGLFPCGQLVFLVRLAVVLARPVGLIAGSRLVLKWVIERAGTATEPPDSAAKHRRLSRTVTTEQHPSGSHLPRPLVVSADPGLMR